MTARGAAARVGVNERTIRRAIARGDLRAVKRRGAFAIDVASLDAWRARRDDPPSPDPSGREPRPRADLPRPVTSLIGRDRELATATAMLRRDDVRLLTLTGAGGIGKTRLGLEVATRLRAEFADGAHIVPLAEVPDAGLVVTAISGHLGLPESGDADGLGLVMAALRDTQALLVLDNFEHVMDAAALVAELLRSCPRLTILVTSRSLLRVAGEHALPVPPLELPDTAIDPATGQVAASPALQLFADRARAITPSFAITPASAQAVAAICHRLGGIPLAIELAASQVTVLPPDALLARIEAHLPLPVGGPRDAPDRQRTMTDAIAWSYDLLPPAERRLFRRVGVFVGGFSLDVAEAVSAPAPIGRPGAATEDASPADPLVALSALVDASLVQGAGDDTARFIMLEPIRAFALERLAAEGELDATFDALADWCLTLVEHSPMAGSVPGGERYLSRLDTEHPNLRRALEWMHQRQDADRLMRLAAALGGYWYERSLYREGRLWVERALATGTDAAPRMRGRLTVYLGLFLGLLGEVARPRELATEGTSLLRGVADPEALTLALICQGAIANLAGDYDRAESALAEALDRAATLPEASRAAAMSARAMSNLGATAHARGDLDAAARWHVQALAICREHGYLIGTVRALCDLADIARDRGELAESLASYREALGILGERSDLRIVIDALSGAALAAAEWGRGEQAARLIGAAMSVVERFSLPTLLPPDREAHERAVRATRQLLDERAFDRHVAAGRRLALSEAIAEVQALAPPDTGRAPPVSGGRLSPREREVLCLLAAGWRDREIADALFISRRTVEGHVARIFTKLEVTTRVEAARAAIDLGFVGSDH